MPDFTERRDLTIAITLDTLTQEEAQQELAPLWEELNSADDSDDEHEYVDYFSGWASSVYDTLAQVDTEVPAHD